MPNHIINVVEILATAPHTEDELRDALLDERGQVEFNLVLPMPVWIPGFVTGDLGMEEKKSSRGRNWYTWASTNWGTKWGAYGQPERGHPKGRPIRFQTAWAAPDGIIYTLAHKGLSFLWRYADEDRGANCGEYVSTNGTIRHEEILSERWAADLWEVEIAAYREAGEAVKGEDE